MDLIRSFEQAELRHDQNLRARCFAIAAAPELAGGTHGGAG
jgi:hypothetical protein